MRLILGLNALTDSPTERFDVHLRHTRFECHTRGPCPQADRQDDAGQRLAVSAPEPRETAPPGGER